MICSASDKCEIGIFDKVLKFFPFALLISDDHAHVDNVNVLGPSPFQCLMLSDDGASLKEKPYLFHIFLSYG